MGQSFSAEPVVEKHTETDQNEKFDAAVSSCQGWRFSQEDNHSLILDLTGEHKASFFAVFDGHGSAKVSKHASEGLWRHITQNEMYIKGNFREALEQSFLTFDREVFENHNAQLAGTTAVCVLIVDNVIYCANIGDSRAVVSVNCECIPLSHDHKPENQLELKRILAAGGYVLGNRVNGNLALSRAFGDFHYKSNEQLPPDQQMVSPFPEIERIELTDDVDFILLACDGIWDVLTSEEVVNFVILRLEQEVRPDQICEQLTTRCLATDYELVVGCDNMTVLLICYTREMSWSDYCTSIFNKNSKKLGLPNRERTFDNNFSYDASQKNHDLKLRHGSIRESACKSMFAHLATSNDNDTSETSGDSSTGRGEFRVMSGLLNNLDISSGATRNSDETPPITEVPAEENEITCGQGAISTTESADSIPTSDSEAPPLADECHLPSKESEEDEQNEQEKQNEQCEQGEENEKDEHDEQNGQAEQDEEAEEAEQDEQDEQDEQNEQNEQNDQDALDQDDEEDQRDDEVDTEAKDDTGVKDDTEDKRGFE